MDKLIEPYSGAISTTRNSTDRSKLAEQLVVTFLRHKAIQALVRWEDSGFEYEELYKSIWNVCQKEPYRLLVQVRKRDGKLILFRTR